MHWSLKCFEKNRPLSGRLTATLLSLILAGSLVSVSPFIRNALVDVVAVQFFIANAIVCGLMAYRLFRIWLADSRIGSV